MRQAALPGGAREAFLDGADDAGCAVGDDQQRVAEPAGAHVLEEGAHRLGVLLGAGHEGKQHLAAVLADAPGGDHRLARLAGAQPLGDAVDIEVDDRVLRQVALRERLVFRPQPLADLAHRRARQQPAAGSSLKASSMSRVDSPRA